VNSGVLYSWTGTGWVAASPAPPFTPSSAINAIAAVGGQALAVLDTGGGIHVSTDAGQTWSKIAGTATSITGGGVSLFVANSSGASYHVNLVVPAITTTGTGSYANFPLCQHPPGCSGYTHTMTVNSKFGGLGGAHGTAGATNTYSAGAAANFNLAVTELGSFCDPFFGDPSDPSCGITWDGSASCSAMGALGGSSGPITVQVEDAFTQAYWNGTPAPICSSARVCSYVVHNNCTAATTPPDLSMSAVISSDWRNIATYLSWINAAGCIRFYTSGPWACTTPLSFINATNIVPPPYECTHNP